ncbi:MAG TPA: YihY/virulence factor BrkB family protein [Pyrinomonadaceae bacterium]|nr:YihY/virulence factor BrkB family protein [Pyrinomonadaceae bacterium]
MVGSLWQLGGLGWKELAKRVWSEINEDDIFGRSAQLSYYFLLALFPLLLFITAVLGQFADAGTELRENLLSLLGSVVPQEAGDLIHETIENVEEGSGGGKISFGILATLWAASNGMTAICQTLNVAYEVEETRPWWKVRLVSLGLTVALAVLILSSLTLTLFGGHIAEYIAASFSFGQVFVWGWKVLQWPVVLIFVLLAFALIYYLAPNVRDRRWHWVSPGAGVAVALWLVVSFGFRAYLSYFNSYNATYGSLGAVIILMLWFYLTGAAILIGGEVNSEIELATTGKEEKQIDPSAAKPASPAAPNARQITPEGTRTPGELAAAARRREREKRRK